MLIGENKEGHFHLRLRFVDGYLIIVKTGLNSEGVKQLYRSHGGPKNLITIIDQLVTPATQNTTRSKSDSLMAGEILIMTKRQRCLERYRKGSEVGSGVIAKQVQVAQSTKERDNDANHMTLKVIDFITGPGHQ